MSDYRRPIQTGVYVSNMREWCRILIAANVVESTVEFSTMCGRRASWLRSSRATAEVGVDALVSLVRALAFRRQGPSWQIATRVRGEVRGVLMRLCPE